MAGELVRQDLNLDLITHEVVSAAPVESIILVGSRATGRGLNNNSDYDVSVVMEL